MAVHKIARRSPSGASRALGSRVRALRAERGWSLEELAHRAGVHVTYLSSVERGHRNPTLNILAALARALSVSLSELVDGIGTGGEE
ncbi:MAG: helix-turn-helix transcriptional regulator [Verrucomicrobiota bacterium]